MHEKSLRGVQTHVTAKLLVGIAEQIHPVAPSTIPEYTQIKDHRIMGDAKVAKRSMLSKLTNNVSHIETEDGPSQPCTCPNMPKFEIVGVY